MLHLWTNQLIFIKQDHLLQRFVSSFLCCLVISYFCLSVCLSGWSRIIFCSSPRRHEDRSQRGQRSPRNRLVRETLLTWVFWPELHSVWGLFVELNHFCSVFILKNNHWASHRPIRPRARLLLQYPSILSPYCLQRHVSAQLKLVSVPWVKIILWHHRLWLQCSKIKT